MTALEFSPYDYRIHEDPYPTYARLRAEAPLYRNDEFDFWALSRHADVVAAFRNLDVFSNANGVSLDPSAYGPHAHRTMSLLATDPPLHTRVRKLIMGALTRRAIAGMEAGLITLVDRLLDDIEARGQGDLIEDFASAIPVEIIGNLLNVPHADRAPLLECARQLLETPELAHERERALAAYYLLDSQAEPIRAHWDSRASRSAGGFAPSSKR